MIERELKNDAIATPSILSPIYKILVIMLTIKHSPSKKGTHVSRIQVFLWAMSGSVNRKILSEYNHSGIVGELPISPDPQLRILLAEAEQRGWIEMIEDGQSRMRYQLSLQGNAVLYELRGTGIYKEIEAGFTEIGKMPDNKLNNVNYVWSHDIL